MRDSADSSGGVRGGCNPPAAEVFAGDLVEITTMVPVVADELIPVILAGGPLAAAVDQACEKIRQLELASNPVKSHGILAPNEAATKLLSLVCPPHCTTTSGAETFNSIVAYTPSGEEL